MLIQESLLSDTVDNYGNDSADINLMFISLNALKFLLNVVLVNFVNYRVTLVCYDENCAEQSLSKSNAIWFTNASVHHDTWQEDLRFVLDSQVIKYNFNSPGSFKLLFTLKLYKNIVLWRWCVVVSNCSLPYWWEPNECVINKNISSIKDSATII